MFSKHTDSEELISYRILIITVKKVSINDSKWSRLFIESQLNNFLTVFKLNLLRIKRMEICDHLLMLLIDDKFSFCKAFYKFY